MAGRGFDALQKHFAPLQIQADERDARFLAGGNFFGREAVAPPPLPPLVFAPVEEGGQIIAGGAGSGNSPPPASLVLKLPTGGGKRCTPLAPAAATSGTDGGETLHPRTVWLVCGNRWNARGAGEAEASLNVAALQLT